MITVAGQPLTLHVMTNQELLQDLTFRSTRIEMSLALLKADLRDLHARLDSPAVAAAAGERSQRRARW